MLPEQLVGHVEALALLGARPHLSDPGRLDGGGLVAEAITDVGEHGGNFVILENATKGSHRDEPVVFFTVELEGAHHAVEGKLDDSVRIARDPVAVSKWRESGVEAFTVGLMAGGTVGVAVINFVACEKLLFLLCREATRGTGGGMFVHDRFLHTGEAVGSGFGGVFAPNVQRFGGGDGDNLFASGVVEP